MGKNDMKGNEEIFSKVLRAGRRTYFFDVRATRAEDYYLTITESKKFTNEDGSFHYKKHKIYLYKEDFEGFNAILNEMTDYILDEKGEEVISDRHQSDYVSPASENEIELETPTSAKTFTDVSFDDI
ncbi:PUR family DNA/RNA-binding protein [Flavimarina sp. Hel_I_48]|uniref:PUR family DNA/RNA-binding protein n=1 Tax=Flavimarina sp. Hel_I_48 TaxID=1392488 RepID=UPI0004DF051B|nr:PUR family DNA/RNA-binding protein [Flavimarina sp. Hel_I_48]